MITVRSTPPVYLIGSVEYVKASVTSSDSLSAQPVTIWIDGTEHAAVWEGSAGTTRICRTSSAIDFTSWEPDLYSMQVEVTDSPEIPLIPAGYISVQTP